MQIRRTLLEGNPVIVAMRPHERPSRRRICCISSARFRLTPLSEAQHTEAMTAYILFSPT